MSQEIFPKNRRIKKEDEFRKALFKGKKIHHKWFKLSFFKNEYTPSRLGLSVSKKSGPAVRRNKIKRIAREWFRKFEEIKPFNLDVVIVFKYPFTLEELNQLPNQLGNEVKLFLNKNN